MIQKACQMAAGVIAVRPCAPPIARSVHAGKVLRTTVNRGRSPSRGPGTARNAAGSLHEFPHVHFLPQLGRRRHKAPDCLQPVDRILRGPLSHLHHDLVPSGFYAGRLAKLGSSMSETALPLNVSPRSQANLQMGGRRGVGQLPVSAFIVLRQNPIRRFSPTESCRCSTVSASAASTESLERMSTIEYIPGEAKSKLRKHSRASLRLVVLATHIRPPFGSCKYS
jgi:hypothetical protein